MAAIFKKEIFGYFISMTAYIFLGFFVLFNAGVFIVVNLKAYSPEYFYVLLIASYSFLILIPILTMRSFAEETKQKTDQLLYTSPITVGEIVLGKFFATCVLFLIGMAVTLIFPTILSFYTEVPWAQIIGSYFGFSLLGITFISIGIFVSSHTDNQIVSAVITFVSLAISYFIIPLLAGIAPISRSASVIFLVLLIFLAVYFLYTNTKHVLISAIFALISLIILAMFYIFDSSLFDGLIYKIILCFALALRFNNFAKGVVNISDIIYYVTFSFAFIVLTVNTLEKKRWN